MLEQYYRSEEGFETIVNDNGFCAYRYDDKSKNFYIGHFFVNPESRKKDGGSYKFFNQVRFRAKALGAERLVGDLYLNVHNINDYNNKVLVHLKHGYKIIDVTDKCITVMKEI